MHFGKRVYVGTGAVFINGTENAPLMIGDDAVIGAGAVVTKSVPPYETWGGYQPNPSANKHLPSTASVESSESAKSAKSADRFSDWQYPKIEESKLTQYNWLVQHKSNLQMGYKTDIGAFTYINAKYGVTIEDHVQVGSHCSLYSVSTIDNKTGPVLLKRNCRIGSHSIVMPGVTIGENAVVGAMSFVNRDVPDGAVVVGVPAGLVGRR
ncbi:MAG: acyltransferase [Pseudomonadota bacterium]